MRRLAYALGALFLLPRAAAARQDGMETLIEWAAPLFEGFVAAMFAVLLIAMAVAFSLIWGLTLLIESRFRINEGHPRPASSTGIAFVLFALAASLIDGLGMLASALIGLLPATLVLVIEVARHRSLVRARAPHTSLHALDLRQVQRAASPGRTALIVALAATAVYLLRLPPVYVILIWGLTLLTESVFRGRGGRPRAAASTGIAYALCTVGYAIFLSARWGWGFNVTILTLSARVGLLPATLVLVAEIARYGVAEWEPAREREAHLSVGGQASLDLDAILEAEKEFWESDGSGSGEAEQA